MLSLSAAIQRATKINGDAPATIMGNRVSTWKELGAEIALLADGLKKLGLETGDRVAILAQNSDRYYLSIFATSWAGGVFVPINTRLAPAELVHWLSDSDSSFILVDDAMAAMLPAALEKLSSPPTIIYLDTDTAPESATTLESLLKDSEPVAACTRMGDDLAGIYYTGGTTGASKGVMLSHHNLLLNVLQTLLGLQSRPGDVILQAAPLFHVAGGLMSFATVMLAGTNVFIPAFAPATTLQAIERHRITRMFLAPTMLNMVLNDPAFADHDVSSLRCIIYGASAMPEALVRQAMEMLPEVEFVQAYGQTETSPVLTILGPERHTLEGPLSGKIRSAGQPVPGVELCIVDENDELVADGTVGEICARGENVMLGYWQQAKLTEKAIHGGWLHTGDGGYLDDDGFLFIIDRMKDMIVSGGENIYPAEVENALAMHTGVAECAVIGVPDEKWGERVHAVVRVRETADLAEDQLITHCRELIAGYKCPRSIEFRSTPLPVSPAGKVLKNELRKPYWQGKRRNVS
jgi:long-chain acyl-CoA synthetase